jgi:hypothetical protein
VADAARNHPRAGGVLLAVAVAVLLMPALGLLSAGDARAVDASVSVSLTDDAGGAALFPGVRLTPGVRRSTCVSINAAGAASGDEVVVAAQPVTGGLAPWIQVDVEVGAGGGHGSCVGFSGSSVYTGTLSALSSPRGDGYPTAWYPAGVATRTFRITVEVQNTPAAPGRSAAFTWRLVPVATQAPSGSPSDHSPTAASPTAASPTAASPTAASPTAASPTAASPTNAGVGAGSGSPTPGSSLTPSATADPTSSDATGVPHGLAGGPGGWGSGAGPDGSDADLYLGQGLVDGIGRLKQAAVPLARTVVGVVEHPQPVLWSGLAAVLFLLVQHRIDIGATDDSR